MGTLSELPVGGNAVKDRIQHYEHTHGFQLLAQVEDVKDGNAAVHIYIGLMCKHIEAAGGEQLNSKRNILCRRLLLLQQIFVELFECRGRTGVVADIVAVDIGNAAVDNGLFPCAQLSGSDQLLTQGHDKLGFQYNGVFTLAVTAIERKRVDVVVAAGGNIDGFAAHRLAERRILALRINDDNIVVCPKSKIGEFLLCRHTFAAARNAEDKPVAVEQIFPVADDKVVGNGVDSVVDAAAVLDFLRLKRHQDRRAFGGHCAQRLYLPQTVRQRGI